MATTASLPTPTSSPSSSYLDTLPERKISRLEKALGPEVYRIIKGLFTNTLSVIGTVLIGMFLLVALLAGSSRGYSPTRSLLSGQS
jgi:hypothetical protein